MKSASNGNFLNGSLQLLHIRVLLVSPLGTGHMAQSGANRHEGGVAVREATHHTGAEPNLPVQAFNDVVGGDTSPVFARKITALAFSRAAFAPRAWIALCILATNFALERGVTANTFR